MSNIYSRENPSPRYIELIEMYKFMHENGYHIVDEEGNKSFLKPNRAFNNSEPMSVIDGLEEFVRSVNAKSLFDYGAGKGESFRTEGVKARLGLDTMDFYDPAVTGITDYPVDTQYDVVICTDVLEHVSHEDIPWVLDEIFQKATKAVFLTITTSLAFALLPDGTNAHCSAFTPEWWKETVSQALKRARKPIKLQVVTFMDRH